MRLLGIIVVLCGWMSLVANAAPSQWEQPAAALAGQLADILGPSQARLTLRNLSSISNGELPTIQRLLEQGLRARGITPSGDESANSVRVTLSENARQRLWVAEVAEGDQAQVAMVELPLDQPAHPAPASGIQLRKDTILTAHAPILSALEAPNGLVVLEPDQIAIYAHTADGWQERKSASIAVAALARDPRGMVIPSEDGGGFDAWLPGAHCTGTFLAGDWEVRCGASDDPWAIVPRTAMQPPAQVTAPAFTTGPPALKAFYNVTRNYFTGIVSPSIAVDLPAFYSAALVPRAAGNAALLVAGVDGNVRLAENGVLAPVAGTRDWGSDLGVIRSGCGTGAQVIASGSGQATSDSLRAYELPALEAVPVSAPLGMQGSVTAIWPAPDSRGVYAAVRTATNQYEVDHVAALCN